MKQLVTQGIVLSRTDYGEADRIVTFLTPDAGKLRLMARGVRKIKSKLAGGIELFSVSDITYMQGRGDMGTLISARLRHHYANIVTDIERVQLGYELLKQINRVTEDHTEPEYFALLQGVLIALDDDAMSQVLITLWFQAQILRLAGHTPNLHTDVAGAVLVADGRYNFDFEQMALSTHTAGRLQAAHIKVLRLLFADHTPRELAQVQGVDVILDELQPLLRTLSTHH